MQEIYRYTPNIPLTYSSFLGAMENFPERHPAVTLMEQDTLDNLWMADCSLNGYVNGRYEFTVSYYSGDGGDILECVSIGVVLQTDRNFVSEKDLVRQTAKMHHDHPGTESLMLFSVPAADGYKFTIGTEFLIEDEHRLGEIDTAFDLMSRIAPLVHGQFCTPKAMVIGKTRGNC
jgi:hypothetical protein